MKTENINLDGLVLGRAASIIASKLLAGYNINAYNVEKLLITGDSKLLLERYTERLNYKGKGNPNKDLTSQSFQLVCSKEQ
jgi:ribosomal protein L13